MLKKSSLASAPTAIIAEEVFAASQASAATRICEKARLVTNQGDGRIVGLIAVRTFCRHETFHDGRMRCFTELQIRAGKRGHRTSDCHVKRCELDDSTQRRRGP